MGLLDTHPSIYRQRVDIRCLTTLLSLATLAVRIEYE